MKVNIGIDTENREAIANALSGVLADSYMLYLKTHNYHWNVTGELFHPLHEQFEEQYTELPKPLTKLPNEYGCWVIGHRVHTKSFMNLLPLKKIQNNRKR